MRIGAFIPQGWRLDLVGIPVEEQWPTMVRVAREIEQLGYESAWVYDHFHGVRALVEPFASMLSRSCTRMRRRRTSATCATQALTCAGNDVPSS